jgi:hypothetical protein
MEDLLLRSGCEVLEVVCKEYSKMDIPNYPIISYPAVILSEAKDLGIRLAAPTV